MTHPQYGKPETRPISVLRVRGVTGTSLREMLTAPVVYGGWQWFCRCCKRFSWGADQADAMDQGRAHYLGHCSSKEDR